MKPNKKLITISNNESQIKQLLHDLVLSPRLKALEWSAITKQTPNMKIGYPGQHLASLVLGMEGERTGARGNDIIDGSEVKSCSRVDQLDSCNDCGEKILRMEKCCPQCLSTKIKRMDDSKWLFTVRNENDISVLLDDVDRVVLCIADYPNFKNDDFEDIRFQVFEIWTKSVRNKHFRKIIREYYDKIYSVHKTKNSAKTPAPCNFWPFSHQFYMCNPIKVFECTVENANNKDATIHISSYIKPDEDRTYIASELMPTILLTAEELITLLTKAAKNVITPHLAKGGTYEDLKAELVKKKISIKNIAQILPFITEEMREYIPLRPPKDIKELGKYRR